MDSDTIVAYLEMEFPQYPSVYPTVEGLQESSAMSSFMPKIFEVEAATAEAFAFTVFENVDHKYFLWKFDERDGIINTPKLLTDSTALSENWTSIQRFFNGFEGLISKNFSAEQLGRLKSGKYLFGGYCSYADILYFSLLFWVLI